MTIKELRKEKGLTQGKFAESIGIGRTTVIGYEKGKIQPSTVVIAKIKEVYGVELGESAAPVAEKSKKRSQKKKDNTAMAEAVAPAGDLISAESTTPKKRSIKNKKKEEVVTTAPVSIKELRKNQGLSQAAFARSIGVSTPTIGAYESGRINPSEKTLEKIKEVYGIDFANPVKEAPVKQKHTRKKKEAEPVVAEEKPTEKAPRGRKKKTEKTASAIIIQSPLGGSITPEEISAKVGPADTIYIRVDENKAYWVRGDETGSVDLW